MRKNVVIVSKNVHIRASLFKAPQNLVIISHGPERDFVFQLVDNSMFIDAWIKSRNMDFYSWITNSGKAAKISYPAQF